MSSRAPSCFCKKKQKTERQDVPLISEERSTSYLVQWYKSKSILYYAHVGRHKNVVLLVHNARQFWPFTTVRGKIVYRVLEFKIEPIRQIFTAKIYPHNLLEYGICILSTIPVYGIQYEYWYIGNTL
jgi:hypothetical protein